MKLYALHLSPDRTKILGNILHVATEKIVYEDLQTNTKHSYLNLAELLKYELHINRNDLLYIWNPDLFQEPPLNPKGRRIMSLTVNPLDSVDDPIIFDVYTRDETSFSIVVEEEVYKLEGLNSIEEVFDHICDYLREEEVNLLEGFREDPVEPKLRFKEFSEVEIGDIAYTLSSSDDFPPTEEQIGEVIWVGDFRDLLSEEEHRELYLSWEVSPVDMLTDYNELVIIRDKDGFNTLFNYNCDPSGALCFTPE